jgi:hypothetical protein
MQRAAISDRAQQRQSQTEFQKGLRKSVEQGGTIDGQSCCVVRVCMMMMMMMMMNVMTNARENGNSKTMPEG